MLGYIPGGTAHDVVTGGSVSGLSLHLELELKDPQVTRISTLDGSVTGNAIHGTVDDGSGPRSILLRRTAGVFHERRFLFAKPSVGPGEPIGILDLSVVLSDRNRFVSGSFVSQTDCFLFACGGVVTAFSEAGSAITGELESGGTCPGSGSFTATFDGTTKFYSGTYTFTSCVGTDSGALIGAKSTRTQTDHTAGILAAAYYSIDVTLNRFRNIKTLNDPDTLADVDTPIGVDFHDRRSGVPLAGGSAVTYRDADTSCAASEEELKFFAEEAGARVVIGNRSAFADLPTLSQFQTNRSDRFLVDIADINAGHPFKGSRAVSPHQGAHVHWDNSSNTWPRGGTAVSNYPPIYAVADGIVDRVDYTFPVEGNDRYGLDLAFARDGCTVYVFAYSIEPFMPEPFPGFYRPFILASRGQRVSKGDIIAYMYLPPAEGIPDLHIPPASIGSHIHFHIKPKTAGSFMAPAIFSEALVDSFYARWDGFGSDGGTPMPSCMGYKLTADENPYGDPVDVLR